jgi:hypothetical protein
MDEQELERRLHDLKDTWRVAPEAPLDQMWARVAQEVFVEPARPLRRRWVRTVLPMAAMLLVGFGLGRLAPTRIGPGASPGGDASTAVANAAPPQQELFVGVANDYLERVTGLLVTLAGAARQGEAASPARTIEYSTTQARDLLATTRLLLDSPGTTDPHLRTLLDDLELVLMQIARLPAQPSAPDVYLIDQALDQRDVLPRLRNMLAENTPSRRTSE